MKTLNVFVAFNTSHLQTKFNILLEASKLTDFKYRMNTVLNLFNLEIKQRPTITLPSSSPSVYDEVVVYDVGIKDINDISCLYFSPNGIFKLMIEVAKGTDKNLFEQGDIINAVKACLDTDYSGEQPTNDIYHDIWVMSIKHAIAHLENPKLQVKIRYNDKFKELDSVAPIRGINTANCIGIKVKNGLFGEAFDYFNDIFDVAPERIIELGGDLSDLNTVITNIKESKRAYGIVKPIIMLDSDSPFIVEFINACRDTGSLGVILDAGSSTRHANFLPDYIFHIEKTADNGAVITMLRSRDAATGAKVTVF
ncbi:hypothetical protein [Proteus mirabilis]|uniref:hypothetical protein n=1 Tax=Proteus mirabilis TaxID=584 RepID=UPI0034D466D9